MAEKNYKEIEKDRKVALPKLPCEYWELNQRRWEKCFGDLSLKQQEHLKNIIIKIEKICEV